jgi:hypothetical protein
MWNDGAAAAGTRRYEAPDFSGVQEPGRAVLRTGLGLSRNGLCRRRNRIHGNGKSRIGDRVAKMGRRGLYSPVSDFRAGKSPQNVGLSAASRKVSEKWDCMADDAAGAEPVSALLARIQGIYREILQNF